MVTVLPEVVLPGKYDVRPTNDQTAVLRVWDAAGHVLTMDNDGPGALRKTGALGVEHLDTHPLFGGPSRKVSFQAGGTGYATIDARIPALWGASTTGPLAVGDLRSGQRWTRQGRFATVLHTALGDQLWAVEQVDENTVVVWVLDETTGEPVTSFSLDDPMGSSVPSLTNIPGRDQVALELGGGQDGIAVLELSLATTGIVVRDLFPHDDDFTTPAWHPNDGRGLSQDYNAGLFAVVTYADLGKKQPQGVSVESLTTDDTQPWGDGDEVVPGFGGIPWLLDGTAIIEMGESRFWRFDPVTMRGLDEIVVEGWEPQPSPIDSTALVGAVTSWERVGRWLVAHGKRDDDHATFVFDEQRLVEQLRG